MLLSIRENELRSEALGYRTVIYRTVANCLGALLATAAGVLYALWLRYTGPDAALSFNIMIDLLLMVVIGGMGTRYGAAIGATLFVLAQNYLQDLMKLASDATQGIPLLPNLIHPDRWLLWLGCSSSCACTISRAASSAGSGDEVEFHRCGPGTSRSLRNDALPNLILVHQETKQERADYQQIARRLDAIEVFIVDTKDIGLRDPRFDAQAPTLTVSPMPIKKFVPPRGPACQGFEYPKSVQYERLERLALPVPKWTRIVPGIALDPGEWGPYLVVKPDLGRKGAEIFIKRTGRVRYRAPAFLAQQFIYTGRWPLNYRVVTLFGRTLMSWRCEADHRFVPLESRWDFKARGGITVVSNKKDSRYTLAFDAGVIALAERAHAAFPDQPVLGTDIVRDADSGALYVIECNPRGDAWLISSVMGRLIEQANGLDFAAQFGALEIAAETLARETRRRAA